jgi:two-component system, LytTR family, response regulator
MKKDFTAILIDDELAARETIKGMLALAYGNIRVVAEADCFTSAVELLSSQTADFIFMDISLGGQTAFDVLDQLPERKQVNPIFVTAHEEFALQSYEYNAFDYILKPVGIRNFIRVVDKKIKVLQGVQSAEENTKKIVYRDFIIVPERSTWQFVKLDEIAYLMAQGSYTKVVTSCNKEFLVSKLLKHFEAILLERSFFVRVHKSYIANIREIVSFDKSTKSLLLRNNHRLPTTIDSGEFFKYALI